MLIHVFEQKKLPQGEGGGCKFSKWRINKIWHFEVQRDARESASQSFHWEKTLLPRNKIAT